MYSKTKLANLALGFLLLSRQLVDVDTDKSNEAKVLLLNWEPAFYGTLADLDLNRTSTEATLELVTANPNALWQYAYKYPTNCAFIRRIQSSVDSDNGSSFLPRKTGQYDGKTVIFTNEEDAILEYIPTDIAMSAINPSAGLAIAARWAALSSPLITGKGAKTLIQQIDQKYIVFKAEAQRLDALENFSMDDPYMESEFVEARTT